MPTIISRYLGDLRTEQIHVASGNTLITDAPVDNQGRGEAFSPTDSVCAALSACMMTIMGIAARTHQLPIEGMQAEVNKYMSASPRRIERIQIRFYNFPNPLGEHQRLILERAALSCPVALSLAPELVQEISFDWP